MSSVAVFVTLGLSASTQKVVIAAVSRSFIEGQRAGKERQNGEEPYDAWRTFPLTENIGDGICQWLRLKGIPAAETIGIVRKVGVALDGMLKPSTPD